jgi:hypothetical protein
MHTLEKKITMAAAARATAAWDEVKRRGEDWAAVGGGGGDEDNVWRTWLKRNETRMQTPREGRYL